MSHEEHVSERPSARRTGCRVWNARKINRWIGRRQQSGKLSRQLTAQIQAFNRSGSARTLDHQLPLVGQKRARAGGKGQWKSWTPEAVLRAAYASPMSSQKELRYLVGSGSGKHASQCRHVVAQCIADGQKAGLRRIRSSSKHVGGRLLGYVVNLMFDETKLPLLLHSRKPRSFSILASHAQARTENMV